MDSGLVNKADRLDGASDSLMVSRKGILKNNKHFYIKPFDHLSTFKALPSFIVLHPLIYKIMPQTTLQYDMSSSTESIKL